MRAFQPAGTALPDLLRRPEARLQGFSDGEILRKRRNGEWTAIARGAYADSGAVSDLADDSVHVLRVRALLSTLDDQAVVSHFSAAVLYGLPLLGLRIDHVHVTRATRHTSRRTPNVWTHTCELREDELEIGSGLRVTSVARTLFDCARKSSFEAAVAMADAGLHRSLVSRDELEEVVSRHQRTPGSRAARRALAFADPRSESVGESRSRVVFHLAGIRPPTLQYRVVDDHGQLIGRTDFADAPGRVVGEFDGRIKYGRLLKPGEDAGDAVYREKVREDAIRATGLSVVRWTWSDLYRPEVFLSRWRRAIGAA